MTMEMIVGVVEGKLRGEGTAVEMRDERQSTMETDEEETGEEETGETGKGETGETDEGETGEEKVREMQTE